MHKSLTCPGNREKFVRWEGEGVARALPRSATRYYFIDTISPYKITNYTIVTCIRHIHNATEGNHVVKSLSVNSELILTFLYTMGLLIQLSSRENATPYNLERREIEISLTYIVLALIIIPSLCTNKDSIITKMISMLEAVSEYS